MILTTSYFPNILYFSYIKDAITSHDSLLIERYENYQKQSYRNRCRIMGDKGCINLTIPVHAYNNIPVKDVTIYDSSWQREHLRTIKTCYGSAPYFPYVIDKIEDLFYIKEKWLIDLNNIILERLLSIINYDISIEFTKEFSPIVQNDSRLITHRNYKSEYIFREYYQVFSEIQPFEPNLSIIDYLMCEGFSL